MLPFLIPLQTVHFTSINHWITTYVTFLFLYAKDDNGSLTRLLLFLLVSPILMSGWVVGFSLVNQEKDLFDYLIFSIFSPWGSYLPYLTYFIPPLLFMWFYSMKVNFPPNPLLPAPPPPTTP